ncbi:MAG TPA: DUF421 domain-containing protein [Firmicutes bacterium]|nr:DUF421 domain-containing protein [Bacillota bacterium]
MDSFISTFIEITVRSVVSILGLFLLAKIIGPRQIAQLTFYDYVVGITIGSIAATVAIDETMPLWIGIWAMAVYVITSVLIALAGNKSIRARRIFSGTPKILLYKGKIIEENLASQKLDLNDLLGACRTHGYFSLDELESIIMEINGSLSFLPKSQYAPVTPADIGHKTEPAALMANVIIDGVVMKNHLKSIGKDEHWLNRQLEKDGYRNPEEVFLAVADANGKWKAYGKNKDYPATDFFD